MIHYNWKQFSLDFEIIRVGETYLCNLHGHAGAGILHIVNFTKYEKEEKSRQTNTLFSNITDTKIHLMGHEADDTKDDKTSKEWRQAITAWYH